MKEKLLAGDSGNNLDISFSQILISWQKQYGRHSLPWQNTRDAYKIWLSEIMLQQTQVITVISYYQRFLDVFPDIFKLAEASLSDVMTYWSGLGYYSRARNLHRCAQRVVNEFNGIFPSDPEILQNLPGIGQSTAAAIAVFSAGAQAAILDGNVVRVFSRVFGITEHVSEKKVKDQLWKRAYELLPNSDLESYTQGLMDLGATLCVRSKPNCICCPFSDCCVALKENRIHEFPPKKVKKAIPLKEVVMLVMTSDNKVLLEKRPELGIWGGLFSLPELERLQEKSSSACNEDVELVQLKSVASQFGKVNAINFIESFTHVFSHFRLHIHPCLIEFSECYSLIEGGDYVWYDMKRLGHAPLPAPVRKLLCGSLIQQRLN